MSLTHRKSKSFYITKQIFRIIFSLKKQNLYLAQCHNLVCDTAPNSLYVLHFDRRRRILGQKVSLGFTCVYIATQHGTFTFQIGTTIFHKAYGGHNPANTKWNIHEDFNNNMIYDKPLRTRYFKTGTSLPEILRKTCANIKTWHARLYAEPTVDVQ